MCGRFVLSDKKVIKDKFKVDNTSLVGLSKANVKIVPKDSITCLETPIPVNYSYYNTATNTFHFLHELGTESSVADSTQIDITFGGSLSEAMSGYGHTGTANDFSKLTAITLDTTKQKNSIIQ